jgi:hypothetical protein
LPRLADVQLEWSSVAIHCCSYFVDESFVWTLAGVVVNTGSLRRSVKEVEHRLPGLCVRRLFDGLLVAEIACALIVLTGAGLDDSHDVQNRQR